MQQYTDENFNQHGVQARTADYRERKVGLLGDFLERIGHGKKVRRVGEQRGAGRVLRAQAGDEGGRRVCGQAAALGGTDM